MHCFHLFSPVRSSFSILPCKSVQDTAHGSARGTCAGSMVQSFAEDRPVDMTSPPSVTRMYASGETERIQATFYDTLILST